MTENTENDSYEIEVTVVSGLEFIAKEEIEELFETDADKSNRGRVTFSIHLSSIKKIFSLKSVENVYHLINKFNINFSSVGSEALQQLEDCVQKVDWSSALKIWSIIYRKENSFASKYYNKIFDLQSTDASDIQTDINLLNITKTNEEVDDQKLLPSFRVTCKRTGNDHSFESPQAACNFGGMINDTLNWKVDLSNFDIEVILIINNSEVRVCVALTSESLHRRNIVNFGPTTLKPTIAYGMMRMCDIKPGEIVCDPMCGTGSIPIETSMKYTDSYHLCGDIQNKLVKFSQENFKAINSKFKERNPLNVDLLNLDVCNLPFRNNSIDVFITDMPFGKRSGSRTINRLLYPKLLSEFARVCKTDTGRACLLTHDRSCIIKSLDYAYKFWKRVNTISINIGGLAACIYILHRTSKEFYKA